jgi:hypothetical protein
MGHRSQYALALFLGATIAMTLAVSPGRTQSSTRTTDRATASVHRSHARTYQRYAAAPAPQRQIACTQLGCHPVPPGCHPEPQRYFSGMTTGFDAVVCP